VLDYLGSANLADPANAYNLVPDAVRAGDFLIERWQRVGIGHTLVVKQVDALPGGSKDVTMISGSMPCRQVVRQSGQSSKSYFTSPETGGPGENSDGDAYQARRRGEALAGRQERRRLLDQHVDGGRRVELDQLDRRRADRGAPARFEQILGQVAPAQQRTELLAQISPGRSSPRRGGARGARRVGTARRPPRRRRRRPRLRDRRATPCTGSRSRRERWARQTQPPHEETTGAQHRSHQAPQARMTLGTAER